MEATTLPGPQDQEMRDVESAIDRMTLGAPWGETSPSRAVVPLAFRRILVATDGSKGARNAVEWAAALARSFRSEVHVLTVIAPPSYTYDRGGGHLPPAITSPTVWDQILATEKATALTLLDESKSWLRAKGVSTATEVSYGSPVARIVSRAEETGADLIIIGSYGAGAIERFLLGSTADGVKQHASCSVLIARSAPPGKRILLPTDGSSQSRAAVVTGLRLAEIFEAEATVLHAVAPATHSDEGRTRKEYEAQLSRMHSADEEAARLDARHVRFQTAHGSPAKVIATQAEREGTDLIVMGSRGLSGMKSRVLGSVSNSVSHRVHASLLLYKDVEY